MIRLSTLALSFLMTASAAGAEEPCLDAVELRTTIEGHGGKWIIVTPEQWQFMRGVYAANPETPPELPPGEAAALATIGDRSQIFFLSGSKTCARISVPEWLGKALDEVLTGPVLDKGPTL